MLRRSIRTALAVCALSTLSLAGCSDQPDAPKPPDPPPKPPAPVTGPLGERPDLPIDDRITIANLAAPVDVVRDKFGRPHVYASNVADAMRVDGYLMALDRTFQIELFRRIAEGRLAEILGSAAASTIDLDISFRQIGLSRVAKAQYDALPAGEIRDALDAFADGVTQVFRKIRSGEIHLPDGIFAIPTSAFTDWTAVDSLAMSRLQTYLLSYNADADLNNQLFFDQARSTFKAADPDPILAKRAGIERDLFRFAPADPATTTTGYPGGKPPSPLSPDPQRARRKLAPWHTPSSAEPDLKALAAGYLAAMRASRRLLNPDGFGSNNWAISPSKSVSGHALLASDPHLNLDSPALFWPVSIDVTAPPGGDASHDLKMAGIAFPGIPGIVLGHNAHVAWGATVAAYDVSDAYAETLSADAGSVTYNGKSVAIQTIDEVINIQGAAPYTYPVKVVPHHGPIVPTIMADHTVAPLDPKAGAVSVRWTGLEVTHEIDALFGIFRAGDVDSARTALSQFGVGAQNWMLADTSGNILWTSHAKIPVRDPKSFQWDAATYSGNLPCLLLPGDGTSEWKGYLPDDLVPWQKNPPPGFLATANNDPIGDTLDNDPSNGHLPDATPMYLSCSYDIGFREGRIQSRIAAHANPFTSSDLSALQADARSPMGAALAPLLVGAINLAEEERATPGSHPDLAGVVSDAGYDPAKIKAAHDLLVAWGKDSDYDAASGMNPDTGQALPAAGASAAEVAASQATLLFNAWLPRVVSRTFGDELTKMKSADLDIEASAKALLHLSSADPKTLATYDPATMDSSIWDDMNTPEIETRNAQMVRALLDALSSLSTLAGPDLSTYRWGAYHTIRFNPMIPLFTALAVPPPGDSMFPNGFPRHGDSFCVDSADFNFVGPASPLDFTYDHGPSQRFVIEMDPAGPRAYNALPGGAVWDPKSPHFRDEAELWRKNQNHPVPFLLADVIAAKETRTVAAP